MILATLIAAASLANTVDDYFPLVTGMKWTYENENGLQLVKQVGESIDIGKGRTVIPMTPSASGQSSASELYHVTENTVFLVGYQDPHAKFSGPNLLGEPQPILKVGPGKSEWNYLGSVPTSNGPASLHVHGESNKGPKRRVLDHEVETLDVRVTSRIGDNAQVVEVRSDAVYAKGIGLAEITEVTKAQGQTVKKVLKLVKFEPPQG